MEQKVFIIDNLPALSYSRHCLSPCSSVPAVVNRILTSANTESTAETQSFSSRLTAYTFIYLRNFLRPLLLFTSSLESIAENSQRNAKE